MDYESSQYYTITPESIRRERERLYSKARHDEAQALRHARREARAEEKQETARKMFLKGFPIDVIAECTELTPEEIEGLR